MTYGTLPPRQGLYDPANEHDACGVGFVANVKGRKSHEIVQQGLRILKGDDSGKRLRTPTIHHSNFGVFAIRHEHWKLILGTKGSGGWATPGDKSVKTGIPHNETGQLYDMAKDPEEKNDLYEQKPEVVKELTKLLDGFKDSGRSVKR